MPGRGRVVGVGGALREVADERRRGGGRGAVVPTTGAAPAVESAREAEVREAYDALKKRAGAWDELSPKEREVWLRQASM